MWLEFLVQIGERRHHEHVHPSPQMALRDSVLEPELVEQPALVAPLSPIMALIAVDSVNRGDGA